MGSTIDLVSTVPVAAAGSRGLCGMQEQRQSLEILHKSSCSTTEKVCMV